MKKASLLLLLNLLNVPTLSATAIQLDDHCVNSLVIQHLDESTIAKTRPVSKKMRDAVDAYLSIKTLSSLNAVDVYATPLIKWSVNIHQNHLMKSMVTKLKNDGFIIIQRNHPLNPHFRAYAEGHALQTLKLSALVQAKEFNNPYDAMLWEKQTDAIVYGSNLKKKKSAIQRQFGKRTAASTGQYIPFAELDLKLEAPGVQRVLLNTEDFYNTTQMIKLAKSLKKSNQNSVVVDLDQEFTLITNHPLFKTVNHWTFTNSTGNGAIGHWFLSGATIPSDFTIVWPENLKSIGQEFFNGAKLSKGVEIELPQNLESVGSNFFHRATLPQGFRLLLPAGLKIEDNFMTQLNIPVNSEVIGLNEVLSDLAEHQGTLSQAMEVQVIEKQKLSFRKRVGKLFKHKR